MLLTMFVVSAAALGACVGSFLNVVIYRLPARQSLGGRSQCPHCGQQIAWRDNVPVFGWLLLRGRARCCQQRIAWRYPLVELVTAAAFLWLAAAAPYGAIVAADEVRLTPLVAFLFQAAFLALLIACTFIDLDHRILPDRLTKPGMVLGLVGSLLAPGLCGGEAYGFEFRSANQPISREFSSVLTSGLGLAVGFAVLWGVRALASKVFRREAMGFGDVKFLAMIGAFLGWRGALLALLLACALGAVGGLVHRAITRESMIPFGPFLALGAVGALFWLDEILVFLLVTWPEWQRTAPAAPWITGIASLLSLLALMVLVRRGRGTG